MNKEIKHTYLEPDRCFFFYFYDHGIHLKSDRHYVQLTFGCYLFVQDTITNGNRTLTAEGL